MPTLWTNEMAMAAVSDPVGSSAVQLTAYCGPAPDAEPGTLVANLQIEPASLRFQTEGTNLQARIQVLFAERGAGRRNATDERRSDDHDPDRRTGTPLSRKVFAIHASGSPRRTRSPCASSCAT